MRQRIIYCLLAMLAIAVPTAAQQTMATVYGNVRDAAGNVLETATIAVKGTGYGAMADTAGNYSLQVPAGRQITLIFSYLNTQPETHNLTLEAGQRYEYNVRLRGNAVAIKEFTKTGTRIANEPGSVYILNPNESNQIASTTDGITATIKSLVGSNNELTSQYTVRGGNYDENLIYVNDFEIYRPYLVRSGQQEGLSFVNSDLVESVAFSLGGFQARYGDKMSSVLDVQYRRPSRFRGSGMLSLLGATLHLEGASNNDKLTYLVGLRQKTNQYLLQAQPTKGVYNPSFTDLQTLINYRFNDRWEMEFIGNYARNRFSLQPERSITAFGQIQKALQLDVVYQGAEIDQFDSRFGGFSTTFRPNARLKLKMLLSGFQTNEYETYDITGEYLLGELETDLGKEDFGNVKYYLGTGIIQNFARNYLKVNVGTVAHRGSYDAGKHNIQWGADATITDISDELHEWERRDSSGFTQPYNPELLTMARYYDSEADFDYTRVSGFLQDNFRPSDSSRLNLSAGVRFNYSTLNRELTFSPRAQATYAPKWKRDVLFKAAAGIYIQPPFYREMRNLQGDVNKDLLSQKSAHFVLGTEHNYLWARRRFKLTTEFYYKKLWDLVPYEYDNVRIRYFGQNSASGYAYGAEARLYGEIVKDATSWLSIGYMKTMEDIAGDSVITADGPVEAGYVPRPTDQRFMVGLFFQDYLPRNENFKMNLNLLYAAGLPFGPPDGNRYGDTLRIPDYKRVDIGFSALLLDGARKQRPAYSFFRNLESIWLSIEVFNLLGIQNTISYSWIQDRSSGGNYAVPNRLTSRLLNAKIIVRF